MNKGTKKKEGENNHVEEDRYETKEERYFFHLKKKKKIKEKSGAMHVVGVVALRMSIESRRYKNISSLLSSLLPSLRSWFVILLLSYEEDSCLTGDKESSILLAVHELKKVKKGR